MTLYSISLKNKSINKESIIKYLKIFLVFDKMTIIIPKKVYQTIVAAAIRFANVKIPEDDWLEVYGVFIGKNEGEDVIISQAFPICHQVKNPEDVIDKVCKYNPLPIDISPQNDNVEFLISRTGNKEATIFVMNHGKRDALLEQKTLIRTLPKCLGSLKAKH